MRIPTCPVKRSRNSSSSRNSTLKALIWFVFARCFLPFANAPQQHSRTRADPTADDPSELPLKFVLIPKNSIPVVRLDTKGRSRSEERRVGKECRARRWQHR